MTDTITALEAQMAELQARIAKEKGKEDAKQQVIKLLEGLGYTVADLFEVVETKPKGKKSQSKYQNPDNKRQRWNGNGAKPQWVLDFEAAGGKLEDIPFGGK